MSSEMAPKASRKKVLFDYQKRAVKNIMERLDKFPTRYNLLFQLPTGGGKTVIFSELTRKYIEQTGRKVLILTHRIELLAQTSRMLDDVEVPNKIINSKVKTLPDKDDFSCFVAMVETLNNRLNDETFELGDVGLVIVDEAHYNSFRKLFKFFADNVILGVTATPLSSNIKLPLKDNYNELIVGESISNLVESQFLAKCNTYSYDVNLRSLKVGINGDYTVASSERLYGNYYMQEKLLYAYEEKCKNSKTLIFNNGIDTSKQVYRLFKDEGYDIRHLDNTNSEVERAEILKWFKEVPNAILSSVSILTTGFDEPTVESIILNRATRSLTLYHQMIGRGSRILPTKRTFNVIDLGNNSRRFNLWESYINWQEIFRSPNSYIDGLYSDEDIEREFVYQMPENLQAKFSNSKLHDFDIRAEYVKTTQNMERPMLAMERAIDNHAKIVAENAEDLFDAFELIDLLEHDIEYRVKHFSYCISKSTENYLRWLKEEYQRKLKQKMREVF